jgi:hypothetical protein
MRRLTLALFLLALGTAALIATVTSPKTQAAATPTEITSYQVTPTGTWTDTDTQVVHQVYEVTINFSHTGPTEARVYEKDTPTATVAMASDAAWFKGAPSSDTFHGYVFAGLPGQTVYFDLILYQRGPHHALKVVDSIALGSYTS